MCVCAPHARHVQRPEGVSDALGLEFQIVNCQVGVELNHGPGGAVGALDQWVISPALIYSLKKIKVL